MTTFSPQNTGGRGFVTVLFALWGIAGLAVSLFALLGAPILTAIYVTLMWMGGTLFFGIFALLSSSSYRLAEHGVPVFVVAKPAEDGFDDEYRGVRYRKLEDGRIVGDFEDGQHTFRNWKQFEKAVPRS